MQVVVVRQPVLSVRTLIIYHLEVALHVNLNVNNVQMLILAQAAWMENIWIMEVA